MKNSGAKPVLTLFSNYGFRKASMSDIADAAGLSRQSIYNRFGTKEAVLDWAVATVLDEIIESAVSVLQSSDGSATDILVQAFMVWAGDHVPLLSGTPHGAEILDRAIAATANAERNYEGEFMDAVTAFVLHRRLKPTSSQAADASYVLGLTSKGLLLKCETSKEYEDGMERVIRIVFSDTKK